MQIDCYYAILELTAVLSLLTSHDSIDVMTKVAVFYVLTSILVMRLNKWPLKLKFLRKTKHSLKFQE